MFNEELNELNLAGNAFISAFNALANKSIEYADKQVGIIKQAQEQLIMANDMSEHLGLTARDMACNLEMIAENLCAITARNEKVLGALEEMDEDEDDFDEDEDEEKECE